MRTADAPGLMLALLMLMGVACGDEPPRKDCATRVWAQPGRPDAKLEVIGSWDGWRTPGIPMQAADEPPWLVARVDGEAGPGEHGYLILEDGVHRRDEHNPLSTYWPEQRDLEVSLLVVPDCEQPALVIEAATVEASGELAVRARFAAASDGAAVTDARVTTAAGATGAARVSGATGEVSWRLPAARRGRHTVTLTARDEAGRSASATASAFVGPLAAGWDDGLLYQVVTDRFRGDGGVALAPPATPGSRAGGTLDGITAEIERGTFAAMGVTGLWISPVYTNPVEAREGRGDGHMYEGYHGYWVRESRGVEPRIGGEAGLERLIAAAHAEGIRVLLDVVPNHIYEDNPRFAARADDRGFNFADPVCVCGLGDCDWGRHIQTCWFTDYLPDLRLEDPATLAAMSADLLWWTRRFQVDGLRVDAVPMMPRAATRRMAHELRQGVQGEPPFLIGEVYTGAGSWGIDAIRYYLGPDGLDSVFDFPLMWAIRDAVAHESAGFGAVEAMLTAIEGATAGSGAVLGRMLGNHDTTRFFSEAHGDAGGDPWAAPAVQADDPLAFARLRSGLTLVLTLPGLPVLYYGDEIGLAGANDPDNRRVLPAWDELGPEQQATRALVQRLGTLRRCLPALRGGSRRAVVVEDRVYAYLRGEGEGAALVLLSSAAAARTLEVATGLTPGAYVDALSGEALTVGADGGLRVELGPRRSRVLVRADSGCAGPAAQGA